MLGLRPVTRGFTLLELLIVMAIVAIVATLAAPSFNGVLERQRVRTVADMLRSRSVTIWTHALMRRI